MKKQKGFTLVELMVGIIILSILGAVFFVSVNTDKSKAIATFASISKTGDALKLSKADLPCYPNRFDVLTDKTKAIASNMSCSIDSQNSWRGPYLQGANFDVAGNLDFSSVVPTMYAIIYPFASTTNAGQTDWWIQLYNVPNTFADEFLNICKARCISRQFGTNWIIAYKFDETR